MLAVLRYGSGLPLNRIEKLQAGMGIPLPASTGWDGIEKLADGIYPVYTELIKQAAQGDVIHNDDTTMKVQELIAENLSDTKKTCQTGIFTTGMLSIIYDQHVSLFCKVLVMKRKTATTRKLQITT